MKVIYKNLRQGEVKALAETAEDLWYLSQLIDPGDIAKGNTQRKVKPTEEAKATRRKVFIAIKVEKIEFSAEALRIGGKIVEGPEEIARGSHHTLTITSGETIEIQKEEWYKYQLERLAEAEGKEAKIIICIFDREDAYFAILKKKKAELMTHLKGEVEKKREKQAVSANFYEQIIKQLEQYDAKYTPDFIILASPSFWKEELMKVLRNAELRKKIVEAGCSSVDQRAINEVLKRPELAAALKEQRLSREIEITERVMQEIAKEGKAVYGKNATQDAIDKGAVETLIITDTLIQKTRAEGKFASIERMMRTVEKQKGEVMIISGEHEGGEKMDGIGGIAALLRYKQQTTH